MRATKVQASLRVRAVSPEPPLLAHTSSESRGTFRQKARSLAPLNGWACAVKICHDGMLEDTNSLDGAHLQFSKEMMGFHISLCYPFDCRYHPLEVWTEDTLEWLLPQGISELEFYGDLVYRIRKIVGKSNSSEQFRKLINRYKRIRYNPYVMRQTACLVINPTSVDSYASLFNCTTTGSGLRLNDGQVGWGLILCLWPGPPWFN